MKIENLLELLSLYGGTIVSTSRLDQNDIKQATASERMYVDKNSLGYVWMPDVTKFPETAEEVEQFEKWFPLAEEFPRVIALKRAKTSKRFESR